jgi:hypothetical protein
MHALNDRKLFAFNWESEIMNAFRVWLRPLGNTFRVRVEGLGNAQWLLDRLGRSFVFKTANPISEDVDSSCCTFHLAYDSQMSFRGFERLLATIPEVEMMRDLA